MKSFRIKYTLSGTDDYVDRVWAYSKDEAMYYFNMFFVDPDTNVTSIDLSVIQIVIHDMHEN